MAITIAIRFVQFCTHGYRSEEGGNTTRAVKINYVDSIHLTNS